MADATSRPPSRLWLYGPFAVVGLLFLAYFVFWRIAGNQIIAAVDEWAVEQRAQGYVVDYEQPRTKGFPFFLRVEIPDPKIKTPDGEAWRSHSLHLDALPYDLTRLIISPDGEQVFQSTTFGEWRINGDDLRASIARDNKRGWVFSVTLGGVSGFRPNDDDNFSLKSLVFDLAPESKDVDTLVLSFAAADFDGTINGEALNASTLETVLFLSETTMLSSDFPEEAWRAAGGQFTINGLNAEINGATINLNGAIGLDDWLRPEGALNAQIKKPSGLKSLLQASGALSRSEANATVTALSLAAFAQGGTINAPIKLEDGKASIAGVALADLEPITIQDNQP